MFPAWGQRPSVSVTHLQSLAWPIRSSVKMYWMNKEAKDCPAVFRGPQAQLDSDAPLRSYCLFHFDPHSKDPQNFIHCRASNGAGESSDSGVCNSTAHWWTSLVIQHYYVSNIIYGLIQCQFYNCIIAIYLHLEKNKSQWNFPLWRTSSGIKCCANQGCGFPPAEIRGSSRLQKQPKPVNLPFIYLKFPGCVLGTYPLPCRNSGALRKPETLSGKSHPLS